MPKTRGNFWSEYEVTVDSNGKEKYTCKTCSGTWSKNASRLKEHIEKCKDINVETETSQPQATAFKEERHTSENIALGLETTMKDADINKFGAIITDNAPNMKAA
uniref:BED-type domain-containing protein n=1 Tax=Rhizophagus irregularis (strain DAOM 181602 / DAOM 197198 / MUCL 43194) TaxID=747089 RepID=U9TJ71_RHIID